MNKSMVRYLLSKLLLIEASLMLIPVIVAFIYHEDIRVINSLVITIGMLVIIGLLGVAFKPKNYHVYTKEGLLIVALCWILWSFFGALPFVLSGQIPSIIDAFFEILYVIYLSMFAILVVILMVAGMPAFDSVITAMGCAGTGGFGVYNDSIAHYNSSLITNIVSIAVLLFGINFNLYYFLLLRKFKAFFKDEELRTYIGIVMIATALIWLNVSGLYPSTGKALENSLFEVANIMTTTGFGVTDLTVWPLFAQVILLFLMFVGGSAGSTAGGIKVMRTLILTKIARNQVLSTLYPHRIMTIHINEQPLDKEIQHGVLKYLTLYVFLLLGLTLMLSLDNNNFMVVVSAATSTFNNIGPMLGTSQTFAIFSPFSKLLMSFAMIAGRLEIYPMLLLFIPKTWSKY